MSKEAIQALVHELELLPETDQRLVLAFLARLRGSHRGTNAVPDGRVALRAENGLLVFTGTLEQPDIDWIQLLRDERDEDLLNAALGRAAHQ